MERCLPILVDAAPPSHQRLRICQTHSSLPWGSGAWPACPWSLGTFSSLLPATFLRICQQVKQTWGSHCLHSGAQRSLARGPETGSTHWGRVAIVSQLASWVVEARPEVVLPTSDGVRAGRACWEGEWRELRLPPDLVLPLLSMVSRLTA